MPRENKSRYAILGTLTLRPMSGYDIKQAIEVILRNFWNESYGQIYPLLHSLAEEGLVTRTIQEQSGRPDRHLYTLTDAGREALRHWLESPIPAWVGRNELLLKLFFGRHMARTAVTQHLQNYRAGQVAQLAKLEELERRMQIAQVTEQPPGPDLEYHYYTVRYGLLTTRALIAWCDETLAAL